MAKEIKKKQKKKKNYKSIVLAVSILIVIGTFFYNQLVVKGATYGWFQADWSGGADTGATANHNDNQSGWNKFYSKDDNINVSTPGQVTLNSVSSQLVETNDEDFVAGSTGEGDSGIIVKDGEIYPGFYWTPGPCEGIDVYYQDLSGTYKWQSNYPYVCSFPQCSSGIISADNSVDFTNYPARDACKQIGGRLPSTSELICIATNQGSYQNFTTNNRWANQESYNSFYRDYRNAKYVSTLYVQSITKSSEYNVRCVRDQNSKF